MTQRTCPSRKHLGKVNKKSGMVSSTPVRCSWWNVPILHVGGCSKNPLAKGKPEIPVRWWLEDVVQLVSYLCEEWCRSMHHQQCSQAVQAPLWLCTLVVEVSVLWMCPLGSLRRGIVCPCLFWTMDSKSISVLLNQDKRYMLELPQWILCPCSTQIAVDHKPWEQPRSWQQAQDTAGTHSPEMEVNIPVRPRVLHSSGKTRRSPGSSQFIANNVPLWRQVRKKDKPLPPHLELPRSEYGS